jgi:hyperosmotically inducible protein
MRYQVILGASVLASAAIIGTPAYVMSQTTTEKVEQKADQAWTKTKSVTQDAKMEMSDSWLTAKTKIALFGDERVKGTQVSVKTLHGKVALRGKVDSSEAKAAAASVAEGVEGVKSVRNDLQVVPPGERKAVDTSDATITHQVQDRLAKNTQLTKVEIRTDSAVVILTGRVPSIAASARASEVARGVPSVRSVKNELTYDQSATGPQGQQGK